MHMFIQVIEGKTSDADGFRRFLEERRPEAMKGAIGFLGATTAIAPDGTVVTMARFESAEKAAKNAARPEQTAFFEELKKYMTGEPTFHESTEVEPFLGGGSDEAGFVQFMIGTATDKAKAKASEKELMPTLESMRPDVLGGITAWDGNWWCQAIYFTSEAEARQGEKKFESMSAGDRDRFEAMMGAYGQPRFVDGPDPILV
jgi:quinol monooxygenase YgiN